MPDPNQPIYHVLLIGINDYPTAPLRGCVNDIDAVEKLLFAPPGIDFNTDQIAVTRLAAPVEGLAGPSRVAATTLPPTRANILDALHALASDKVRPEDRVLIYYSGHGGQKVWDNAHWHETIVPQDRAHVYDVELNAWIAAIAGRTSDLTIVLDSCHSAGATKGIEPELEAETMAFRYLPEDDLNVATPVLDLPAGLDVGGARDAAGLLTGSDPNYLVVAACQDDQKALERDLNGVRHGLLTYSLTQLLAGTDQAANRARLRWADVWQPLRGAVSALASSDGDLRSQLPALIGRSERHVFGGPWQPGDPGIPVTQNDNGSYIVGAGTLLNVNQDTELAIYSDTPLRFSPLGSAADLSERKGLLRVIHADRSLSTAQSVDGQPFALPLGARARIVSLGQNSRLQVRLASDEPGVIQFLNESGVLNAGAGAAIPSPDVSVTGTSATGWTIGNDAEPQIAVVPSEQEPVLRAGLEHLALQFNTLRLAANSNDEALRGKLGVQLLDCASWPAADAAGAAGAVGAVGAAMMPGAAVSPASTDVLIDQLPDARRGSGGVYELPEAYRFCIAVRNRSATRLQYAALNCTAGGKVEVLGQGGVEPGDRQVVWSRGNIGKGFVASPSMHRTRATDRLVVVATTNPAADLAYLEVDGNVQDIVTAMIGAKEVDDSVSAPTDQIRELWTAVIVPIVIYRP